MQNGMVLQVTENDNENGGGEFGEIPEVVAEPFPFLPHEGNHVHTTEQIRDKRD